MIIENRKKFIYGIVDNEMKGDLLSVFLADNDAAAVRSFKAAVNNTKFKLDLRLLKLCSIIVKDLVLYETNFKENFEDDIHVICDSSEVYSDNAQMEQKKEEASEV